MAKKKTNKRKVTKKRVVKKKAIRRKSSVKRAVKRTVKKKAVKRKVAGAKKPKAIVIGTVTHYFPHVRAAVIKLKVPLAVGDTIKVKGHTTDFTEVVNSMQIDRVPVTVGKKGDEIGLLVNSRVRQHDVVYKG